MEQLRDALALDGKNVVVLGVADESSIAWGIAKAFAEHRARVVIGYQQRFFSRVRLLLERSQNIRGGRCDVTNEAEMAAFFAPFRSDPIDVLVHSIAHAPAEVFTALPSEVSAEAREVTMTVSAWSLPQVIRFAKPALAPGGSVITMSFQAASRAAALYGMMGVAKSALESLVRYLALELGKECIRVNAISPAPVETLAGYGEIMAISADPKSPRRGHFGEAIRKADEQLAGRHASDGLEWVQTVARNFQHGVASQCAIQDTVSKEDVAGCALFLGSRLSSKITGQVIHVDCGLSSTLIL